jgi:hypothetical protein
LTSFAGVLGFEVSRYFAINDRACLTRLFFARTGIKPASCKAFSFRNRSQMGSIEGCGCFRARSPFILSQIIPQVLPIF